MNPEDLRAAANAAARRRQRLAAGGKPRHRAALPKLVSNMPAGPGTELSALLADWLGIVSSPACGCRAMAARMDAMGPEWCESDEGMAEIIGVMRAEHGKRKAAGQTMLPWTDLGARTLVRLACRRARAKAAAPSEMPEKRH